MTRTLRYLALGAALLATAACSDSTGPDSKLPPLGAYDYSFDGGGRAYAGTFTLTYATADSIAGRFDVPGVQPVPDFGWRNGDAWVFYLDVADGIQALRLDWRGGRWACDGRHLVGWPVVSIEASCSLRKR